MTRDVYCVHIVACTAMFNPRWRVRYIENNHVINVLLLYVDLNRRSRFDQLSDRKRQESRTCAARAVGLCERGRNHGGENLNRGVLFDVEYGGCTATNLLA